MGSTPHRRRGVAGRRGPRPGDPDDTDTNEPDAPRNGDETDRYRCLVENAPYCIHELDRDGCLLSMNATGLGMLGATEVTEVRGHPYLDIVSASDRERVARLMHEALDGHARHFEYEGASGAYYRSNFIPIRGADGRVERLMGITQDLTEQREAALALRERDAQLHQARKMEAIGRLAGGIAHDFNNLLMAIQGNVELLGRRHADAESRELTDEIRTAAGRAASLVRQLLTFSRRSRIDAQPVAMSGLIEEVLQFLRRSLDHRIRLRVESELREFIVVGDADQLHSAILNLVLNARDAMPGGGELDIHASRVRLDSAERRDLGVEPAAAEFLRLEVRDTGAGIPADVLPHVFEPFFTTKPEGTGLGLATAYAITLAHRGALRVASEPGTGTCFTVWLPLTAKISSRHVAERPSRPPGDGPLLVVDDDEGVRRILAKALAGCGYRISEAADGLEAMRTVETEGDRLRAVVLDLAMPGLGGHEVLREILERNPDLPVLILTGFADDETTRALLADGAACVLTKPVELDELADAVGRFARPAAASAAL